MHDIKDYSIGLLQPSSQDLHDKIFKLSPPLTLGKKEKFWEILQIIAYNEFKLRNNKSWYYGRKNGLTNWNELSEATVLEVKTKMSFHILIKAKGTTKDLKYKGAFFHHLIECLLNAKLYSKEI